MAIVKAPSQNSLSLLDLSTTPAQLNGKLGGIPGGSGAAPGSFQLLFQGSMQAQGRMPASGESLPADGENLPANLPQSPEQTDSEVEASSGLEGMELGDSDPTDAQQQGAELIRPELAAGKEQNTATGQLADGTTSTAPSTPVQGLQNGMTGNQPSAAVSQSGQVINRSQTQQPITGEAKGQTQTPGAVTPEVQTGRYAQVQPTEASSTAANPLNPNLPPVQGGQADAEQRQPRPDSASMAPSQAEVVRPGDSQSQSSTAEPRLPHAEVAQVAGSQRASQAQVGRTQLPETANQVARDEAEARVAASKASENPSQIPHPLTTATEDGLQTTAAADSEQLSMVKTEQGMSASGAKPVTESPLPGTISTVPVTESTTGSVTDLDPVTLQARLDAVQAKEAMSTGMESRAPTQLVAPASIADSSQTRQAQLDGANAGGRGSEGTVRADLAALNASGAGTGGAGGDAEGGDSNQKQDSGTQATAVQNSQSRTSQSVPTPAQTQAQLDAHQQLLTPRWGQAVGERMIMMAQHGPRSAQIQLDPPELGSMQIRIHVQGQDQISVSFTSANPAVRDALEQQMPRLREMLAEQGLQLSEGAISDDSSRRGQDSDSRGSSDGRAGGYASGSGNELDAEALPGPAVAVGLVDYYA